MTQQQWPGVAPATASAAYAGEPQPARQPEPEVPAPPQIERLPTIAERLMKLAEPIEYDGMAELAPEPMTALQPGPEERPAVEQDAPEMTVRELLAVGGDEGHSYDYGKRSTEWLRPALLAGGLVASVGLVGGLASFALTDNPVPTISPATTSAPVAQPSPPLVAAAAVKPQAAAPIPAAPPAARQAPPSSRFERAVAKVNRIEGAAEAAPTEVAAAQPVAQPEAAQTIPASMPLPNRVVARTIEKIGYSCGSVTSTAAVEGSSGAFNITCSSGQTYRATPVNGHYRFRRSG